MGVVCTEEWVRGTINFHDVETSGSSLKAIPDEEIVVVLVVRDDESKPMVHLRLNPSQSHSVFFELRVLCAWVKRHPDVA